MFSMQPHLSVALVHAVQDVRMQMLCSIYLHSGGMTTRPITVIFVLWPPQSETLASLPAHVSSAVLPASLAKIFPKAF